MQRAPGAGEGGAGREGRRMEQEQKMSPVPGEGEE